MSTHEPSSTSVKTTGRAHILLVDDDEQALESTKKILEHAGYDVTTARDGAQALRIVRPSDRLSADLIVTDVRMPELDGLELLKAVSVCRKSMPVILMTAFGRVEDAVEAMKLGAVDFLTKPFKRKALLTAVDTALKRVRSAEGDESSRTSGGDRGVEPLLGESPAIRRLRELIGRIAPTEASVMIHGESGTGKELVARHLHAMSARSKGPFVGVNCAAIPENLIESELFGYERGAFSGAVGSKPGLFESADGGTLLLDEIGDMPLAVQVKLLRVLQEGEVRRVGATRSRRIDVRVITATHRDLRARAKEGLFREDLLFRLEVVSLAVPGLRERTGDIPVLARHFLARAVSRHGKNVHSISPDALEVMVRHDWPGNVRELSNVIERAVVLAEDTELNVEGFPPPLLERVARKAGIPFTSGASGRGSFTVPLGTPLRKVEELLIQRTLEATSGDKAMTARLLGINSRTIYRKLEKRDETEKE